MVIHFPSVLQLLPECFRTPDTNLIPSQIARMKKDFRTELAETGKPNFEQEVTEKTEIQKKTSLFPLLTPVQIRLRFSRLMLSFDSALCSLCSLLFKTIWLRSSLCALCVLLWQSVMADMHYVD